MSLSKDFLEKLSGKWITVFSNDHQSVDIELTINKEGNGNVKFVSGTKTKVVFFRISFELPLNRDDVDLGYEVTLYYTKSELYKGTVKVREDSERGKLYTIVAFLNDEIYFPFPNKSSEGESRESRIVELNQAFKRSKGKLPAKNSVLDLIFTGSHSVLVMAGIHFNEKLQFVEACDETHIYHLSSYDTTVYNELDKFKKVGCSLERVERFKWIYSLFTERRDYKIDCLRTHWNSIDAIDQTYQAEKEQLGNDVNLALYWVLHFGLLQDERLQELKIIVNDELVKNLKGMPIGELLKDAVLLVDAIAQGKKLPSVQLIWYKQYYKNLFATSYNRSYTACLHSLIHQPDSPNTKAYWVVKNANYSNGWHIINERLSNTKLSDEQQGISYIQANNPELSTAKQSYYAEEYLNEMIEHFRQYKSAFNSWASIMMIYKKVTDYTLLEKAVSLYFKSTIAIDDDDITIEKYAEIVDYLHEKGLNKLKALKPIEEAIYEKIDAYGYTQIILRRYKSFISHKNKNLNEDKLEKYKTTGKALKAKFKKIETTLNKEGYTKVSASGKLLKSLANQEIPKQTIKRMNYSKFKLTYPNIFLDERVWFDNFYVYEEDMSFDTHLDLDAKGDFKGGHFFLKDLIVNGDILNRNSDYGHPLQVVGKTSAHSIISGGAFLIFNGDVILKDLLAVYYNHGETSFKTSLTARLVLDDDDHFFSKPAELNIQYLFVNYPSFSDNEKAYKVLDYIKLATLLKGEPWLDEDVGYDENGEELEEGVATTSAWTVVKNISNYEKFTDKVIKGLSTKE